MADPRVRFKSPRPDHPSIVQTCTKCPIIKGEITVAEPNSRACNVWQSPEITGTFCQTIDQTFGSGLQGIPVALRFQLRLRGSSPWKIASPDAHKSTPIDARKEGQSGGSWAELRRLSGGYLAPVNAARPLSVRRYFWSRLWGLSGIVRSITSCSIRWRMT